MTDVDKNIEELKELIKIALDQCDPLETPTVCSMNVPNNYQKLEEMILDRILKGEEGTDVFTAIQHIEREYNPNMLDD